MAGLWYRTGSVAVTQSSKKITGTGTSWQTALNRPSKGNVFYGPDGKAYEIDYISSETELYLVDVYTGANASSQSYKIDVRGGTVPELSRQLSEHYAYMQGIIDSLQSIVSGSGDVTITGPSGQTVTVPALANMLSKSGNLAGLADKQTARSNLALGDAATKNVGNAVGVVPLLGNHASNQIITGGLGAAFETDRLRFQQQGAAGDSSTELGLGWCVGEMYRFKSDLNIGVALMLGANGAGMLTHSHEQGVWRIARFHDSKSMPVVPGSFTPIINVPGVEIRKAVGKYWRKGDVCNFQVDIIIGDLADAPSDNSSDLKVSGLPFTMADTGSALPLAISEGNLRVTNPVAVMQGTEIVFFKKIGYVGDTIRVSDIKPKTYGGWVTITLSGWYPIA